MNLSGMTPNQAEQILEYVAQARDGLITKNEMANKIEAVVCIDGVPPFETQI